MGFETGIGVRELHCILWLLGYGGDSESTGGEGATN